MTTYTFAEIQTAMARAGNNPDATDEDIRNVSNVLLQMSFGGTKTIDADDLDGTTQALLAHFLDAK